MAGGTSHIFSFPFHTLTCWTPSEPTVIDDTMDGCERESHREAIACQRRALSPRAPSAERKTPEAVERWELCHELPGPPPMRPKPVAVRSA